MSTVIKVENLSKRYIIGHQQQERYLTFRDTMAQKFKEVGKRLLHPFLSSSGQPLMGLSNTEELWALKDVSFEVKQGERIGIIGRNGAGKTTLLKLISQITEPTTGRISIRGRVASLLEVGTGFHPELTGRENIYLNGAILGMNKAEIRKNFDEIVSFAEVEKLLDTPVKRYSSGMYVRLAFSIAAHLDPEILIVDEVLAVGDFKFQKKCLGKMQEVGKKGRTVLFVSHSMDAIMRLCENVVLLKEGIIQAHGNSGEVINKYLREDIGSLASKKWKNQIAPGNEIVRLLEVCVHDINGDVIENFDISKPIQITVRYEVLKTGYILRPALNFFNIKGINIFDSHDANPEWRKVKETGVYKSTVQIPGNFLTEGIIIVGAAIITPDPFSVHLHEKDVIAFNVVETYQENSARGDYVGSFPGVIRPLLKWDTKLTGEKIFNT